MKIFAAFLILVQFCVILAVCIVVAHFVAKYW